jgi:hypothetical protein
MCAPSPADRGRLWRLLEASILGPSWSPWVRLIVTLVVVAIVYYVLRS